MFGHDEKILWAKRVGLFIRTLRSVLGNRSYHTSFGGSVLDSVVGTYLTQVTVCTVREQFAQ